MENFIKGEYGAIETKGGSLLQFVDKEGNRVALSLTLPICMKKGTIDKK
jgi:cytochrome c oxidase subunit 3